MSTIALALYLLVHDVRHHFTVFASLFKIPLLRIFRVLRTTQENILLEKMSCISLHCSNSSVSLGAYLHGTVL